MQAAGLCECGCGRATSLARQTDTAKGYVKGEPLRFVRGHNTRKLRPLCACGCGRPVIGHRAVWIQGHDKWRHRPEPNPSGLCMCGCGQSTPIAKKHRASRGDIAGKPVKYIRGHYGRVFEQWALDERTGCWVWTGRTFDTKWDTRPLWGDVLAYRKMYEMRIGPIPDGCHLHHTCENPMCVNPEHLEPLTPLEHKRRHLALELL